MTARQVWEGMLTELSKVNAPSMLLQDFNYFFNKAINQYINKRYNIYDINQQTTDDLRVLKATSILPVRAATDTEPLSALVNLGAGRSKLLDATYEVDLPLDYLHILNCICIYKVNKRYKCYNAGDYVQFSAKRLTGDSWATILNDYYSRPLPERPYYYIHNVNTNVENDLLPTNPSIFSTENIDGHDIKVLDRGTDLNAVDYEKEQWLVTWVNKDGVGQKEYFDDKNGAEDKETTLKNDITINDSSIKTEKILTSVDGNSNFPREIKLRIRNDDGTYTDKVSSNIEKSSAQRYGNTSKVRMEVRYGHDRSVFELQKVFVDYIKTPLHIRLTQEQVNLTEDTSQIMEFPDYVCQEIINELTMLVMENTADPRLQTNTTVTQSIANPAQQLAPQPQPQAQQRG